MMFGLVIGSILSSRIKNFKVAIRGIGIIGIIWALFLLAMSFRLQTLSGFSGSLLVMIFFIFLVIQGILVGGLYPQNVNYMVSRKIFGERRMGVAYALDLVGASVGSLLLGTLLLPVLGIQTCLAFLMILLALSIPWML